MTNSANVIVNRLPQNLSDMLKMPEAAMRAPEQTAFLTVAALCAYAEDRSDGLEMLNYLRGSRPLGIYDQQFLADRFKGQHYIPFSYFEGAVPENGYTPEVPYRLALYENFYSRDNLNDGFLTLYLRSGGAMSERPMTFRLKPSTGQWFLWEQSLMVGIRTPMNRDPWGANSRRVHSLRSLALRRR
ncbi:MAG: hypothetical protein IIU26_05490 [Clostridium sp.]|jgi:hypothetical protein|nr:hypothetical protein [Clostridium sp.]